MSNIRNRAIAAVTAAAIALTTAAVTPANAGPRYYPRGNGNAAAASIMLGIIGAVGAYAAAREYRKAQEDRYYNGPYGGPYGYGGPHRYYGY
jgi:hypothetical protein